MCDGFFCLWLEMTVYCTLPYSTNPERPGDLKESFDIGTISDEFEVVKSFLMLMPIFTVSFDKLLVNSKKSEN